MYYVIGENHNNAAHTNTIIRNILKKTSKQARIAIVTEFGMCPSFQQIDARIAMCVEEPEKLNILSSVVSLMALLCHYDTVENKETFDILYPRMQIRGYIPSIEEVKTKKGRKEALRILFGRIEQLLQQCTPLEQLNTYSRYIKQWLEDCTDTTSSMSLANDLRDRWLVNKAKELSAQYDHVIVIAGVAHVSKVVFLLRPDILSENVYF